MFQNKKTAILIGGGAAFSSAFLIRHRRRRKSLPDSSCTAEIFTGLPDSDELRCPFCGRLTSSESRYCVRCWGMIR